MQTVIDSCHLRHMNFRFIRTIFKEVKSRTHLKNLMSIILSLLSICTFSFDSSNVWICIIEAVSWRAYLLPSGPQSTLSGWSLNDFVNASRPLAKSHALSVLSLAIVSSNLPLGSALKSRTGALCFNALISSQSSNDHILQKRSNHCFLSEILFIGNPKNKVNLVARNFRQNWIRAMDFQQKNRWKILNR